MRASDSAMLGLDQPLSGHPMALHYPGPAKNGPTFGSSLALGSPFEADS